MLTAAFAVGLLTGLLANGGGFLLVPMFVLLLGLTAAEAAGTSMLAVGVLTVRRSRCTSRSATSTGRWRWPSPWDGPGLPRRHRVGTSPPCGGRAEGLRDMLVTFALWFLLRLAV